MCNLFLIQYLIVSFFSSSQAFFVISRTPLEISLHIQSNFMGYPGLSTFLSVSLDFAIVFRHIFFVSCRFAE